MVTLLKSFCLQQSLQKPCWREHLAPTACETNHRSRFKCHCKHSSQFTSSHLDSTNRQGVGGALNDSVARVVFGKVPDRLLL